MKQQQHNIKHNDQKSRISFSKLFQSLNALTLKSPVVAKLTRSGMLAIVLATPSAVQSAQRSLLNANDYGNRLSGNQEIVTGFQNWVVSPKHEAPVVQVSSENSRIKEYVSTEVNESNKWPMVIQQLGEELGFPVKNIADLKLYFDKGGVLYVTYYDYGSKKEVSEKKVTTYEELEKLPVIEFDLEQNAKSSSTLTIVRSIKYFDSQISYVKNSNKTTFSQNKETGDVDYLDGRLVFGFPFINLKKQDVFVGLDYIANLQTNAVLNRYLSATDGANSSQTTNNPATNNSKTQEKNYSENFLTELGLILQTNWYLNSGSLFVQGSFHGKVLKEIGGPQLKDTWQRFGLQAGFAPYAQAHWSLKALTAYGQMASLSLQYDMNRYAVGVVQTGSIEINADKAIADYQTFRAFYMLNNPGALNEAFTKWFYKYAQLNIGAGFNMVTQDTELENLRKFGFSVTSNPINPVFGAELYGKLPEVIELISGLNPNNGHWGWMFAPYKVGTGITTSKGLMQWSIQGQWRIPGTNAEATFSYGQVSKDALPTDRTNQLNSFIRAALSYGF